MGMHGWNGARREKLGRWNLIGNNRAGRAFAFIFWNFSQKFLKEADFNADSVNKQLFQEKRSLFVCSKKLFGSNCCT